MALPVKLQALRSLCLRWGGDLVEVNKSEAIYSDLEVSRAFLTSGRSTVYCSPFDIRGVMGIDWTNRVVYVGADQGTYNTGPQYPNFAAVIHEMGHAFVCRRTPYKAKEWPFFGWEVVVSDYIGASRKTWVQNSGDYYIGTYYGRDLGDVRNVDPQTMGQVLDERIQHAQKIGLVRKVNGRLTPLAIR